MRRGFTLVELLVTIAVIAVVAAILIPAWQIVDARAKSAKCLSNLSSLGIALQGYLSDHNNTMPTLKSSRASVNDQVPVIDNTLNTYAGDQRVFVCPADPSVAVKAGTSYYWNSFLNGQNVATLQFKIATLVLSSQISQIPILADTEGWHKYAANRVNILYADGHATANLNFTTN